MFYTRRRVALALVFSVVALSGFTLTRHHGGKGRGAGRTEMTFTAAKALDVSMGPCRAIAGETRTVRLNAALWTDGSDRRWVVDCNDDAGRAICCFVRDAATGWLISAIAWPRACVHRLGLALDRAAAARSALWWIKALRMIDRPDQCKVTAERLWPHALLWEVELAAQKQAALIRIDAWSGDLLVALRLDGRQDGATAHRSVRDCARALPRSGVGAR
jgi:hypothetical protein